MNRNLVYTYVVLLSTALIPVSLLRGDWITIADFDSYQAGWGEDEIKAAGWTMQDGDYVGFSNCVDGTNDCTALREITTAPYSPDYGSSIAMMIRAGDPDESQIANSLAHTAISLPQEIPVNGKATVYFRVARGDPGGEIFFCLSDLEFENKGPVLPQGDLIRGYVDNSIIFRMRSGSRDNTFDVFHGGGYLPALIKDGDPDYSKVENEVWYDVWLHIDNQDPDTGDEEGGRYDLYILGGKYGTYGVDEPVHATITSPAYANAGYTSWFFRRDEGEPLRTFNLLSQYGNPNDNPLGTGATWINALAMAPGEFVLNRPGESSSSDWNGYTVINGWADTGDWMGWLYIEHDPWIYCGNVGWFYKGSVEAEGGWVYAVK